MWSSAGTFVERRIGIKLHGECPYGDQPVTGPTSWRPGLLIAPGPARTMNKGEGDGRKGTGTGGPGGGGIQEGWQK